MKISLIVARAQNGVIGSENKMPWHLPDDLRFFKKHTSGKPIIMGRNTWQSIGRPLPKRTNIVVSRNQAFRPEGGMVVRNMEDAFSLAGSQQTDEVFVIGGGQIYQLALPVANRLYLTEVKTTLQGDTFFPDIDLQQWQEIFREPHPADEQHAFPFEWVIYDRIDR